MYGKHSLHYLKDNPYNVNLLESLFLLETLLI
jgi:hypothetical protein